MSFNSQPLKLRGSVFFDSPWNLQITAGVLSDHIFAGTPFSSEVPGLREEVPAVELAKEIFGLTFVLHGVCEGEGCQFTLDAHAGKTLHPQLISGSKTVDIGRWLAQLVATIPEFNVVGCSPINIT